MGIFSWLFPEKCLLCGKVLEEQELDLCSHCRVEAPVCGGGRVKHPFLDDWTALWYYEADARSSLLRYNFMESAAMQLDMPDFWA